MSDDFWSRLEQFRSQAGHLPRLMGEFETWAEQNQVFAAEDFGDLGKCGRCGDQLECGSTTEVITVNNETLLIHYEGCGREGDVNDMGEVHRNGSWTMQRDTPPGGPN